MKALLVVMLAAVPARADHALSPDRIPNRARSLADKGRASHQAGDYETAIAAFKEAYVLAPSPGLLFNIAQSYRLAGDCDDASWMYRRFLDTNPIGDHRRLAEHHLAAVKKCATGSLRVTAAPPPTLEAKVPEPKLDVHDVVAPEDRGHTLKRFGWIVGAGGLAALAGAAIFALDAHDAEGAVDEAYRHGGKWSDIEELDARGKRSAVVATALGITGGVATASGIVLFAVGRHQAEARHVAVIPTRHGAQVSLTWGF